MRVTVDPNVYVGSGEAMYGIHWKLTNCPLGKNADMVTEHNLSLKYHVPGHFYVALTKHTFNSLICGYLRTENDFSIPSAKTFNDKPFL